MSDGARLSTLHCNTHGIQPETIVCVHIIESIGLGEPLGFWWTRGDDGRLDAVCSACNALSQPEFDRLGAENIKGLCLGCFEDAAVLNGVELA